MYFINKKILNQTVQTCVIVGLCRHSVVFSVTEYVTNVLEDARVYCAHAKKKNIDLDDVKLAVQMQLDQNYTTPPPRDVRYSHTHGFDSAFSHSSRLWVVNGHSNSYMQWIGIVLIPYDLSFKHRTNYKPIEVYQQCIENKCWNGMNGK